MEIVRCCDTTLGGVTTSQNRQNPRTVQTAGKVARLRRYISPEKKNKNSISERHRTAGLGMLGCLPHRRP